MWTGGFISYRSRAKSFDGSRLTLGYGAGGADVLGMVVGGGGRGKVALEGVVVGGKVVLEGVVVGQPYLQVVTVTVEVVCAVE